MVDARKVRRCAIYTRKSSDEGLEQSYNSLAAQRDACAAYVISQKHEGWVPIEKPYDDGGYSGGSLDRPALQMLFADLRKGEVDIIVVYKVDRLTRSLADFAKLTELFDQHTVSFVAVTQQFNTSTSMGRLTLNVLLSFAQFEREVAGERIRDKIQTSKQRGMWMGGHPPLSYDARERKLVINPAEAETVQDIFRQYLKLGSVRLLCAELKTAGITSKPRVREDGSTYGALPMKRGALSYLLTNPIYRGLIRHKGRLHTGQHEAIVPEDLFNAVQEHMIVNGPGEAAKRKLASPSLLKGLVFDDAGSRLQPTHAKKYGRKYRYYVSASIIKDADASRSGIRVPAPDLEQLVIDAVASKLRDHAWVSDLAKTADARQLAEFFPATNKLAAEVEQQAISSSGLLHKLIAKITVGKGGLRIDLSVESLHQTFGLTPLAYACSISIASHLLRCGKQMKLILGHQPATQGKVDPRLVKEVVQARNWFSDLACGKATSIADLSKRSGFNQSHVSRRITLALLAPDIVEMILMGTQPVALTPERLKRACPLPCSWDEQRALLRH